MNIIGYRAELMHFVASPYAVPDLSQSFQHFPDGLLLVQDGHILDAGDYQTIVQRHGAPHQLNDYRGKLLLPGFVDVHTHYPQLSVIGSYGEKLLTWLTEFTFPAELKFADSVVATAGAQMFLRCLVRHGTTTAGVFATTHKTSVEALFQAAQQWGVRILSGKVMMDRNAPAGLLEEAHKACAEAEELIQTWHGRGRIQYAITPRFAPVCSSELLSACAGLQQKYPTCLVQTHLSENKSEGRWVAELFPSCRDYLDVYDHYGLLGPRTIFAHAIHLSPAEYRRLAEQGATVAFCPTSNLFLGSGLFDMKKMLKHKIGIGFASDIGGGTSFSMLRTLDEAYKVCQLRNYPLSPLHGLYHATLGGAAALSLDHLVGNFTAGKEADFIVVDPAASELLAQRWQEHSDDIAALLFALFVLGDDRNIAATFVAGTKVHDIHQIPVSS